MQNMLSANTGPRIQNLRDRFISKKFSKTVDWMKIDEVTTFKEFNRAEKHTQNWICCILKKNSFLGLSDRANLSFVKYVSLLFFVSNCLAVKQKN